MLNLFYHLDDDEFLRDKHRFPFVYLHGQAEEKNNNTWAVGAGSPPDMCVADVPLESVFPKPWNVGDTRKIDCLVDDIPALCVLHVFDRTGLGDPSLQGRVALLHDTEALEHSLKPQDWR